VSEEDVKPDEGQSVEQPEAGGVDWRAIVKAVVEEFVTAEQGKAEPVYQAELGEERKRRESLEQRVNELVAENQRSRAAAEQAERSTAIRTELQRLGVVKVELAYRAVKDEVYRSEDGRLMAQGGAELKEYLNQFVGENPELLPARLWGGSGAGTGQRSPQEPAPVDLSRIKPGMDAEEMDRARQEIARVAARTLKGL
jgi:hypothetical protein